MKKNNFPLLLADDWQDYELLDSGEGHKLERFGPYKFMRPDSQAYWKPVSYTHLDVYKRQCKPQKAKQNWKPTIAFFILFHLFPHH